MKTDKLSRCPFCKCEVVAISNSLPLRRGWYIYCAECEMFWGYHEVYGGLYPSKAKLTKEWNEVTGEGED